MKKLLLLGSFVIFAVAWSCNNQTAQNSQEAKNDKEIRHGHPDQPTLDSLKAAKTKKRKAADEINNHNS